MASRLNCIFNKYIESLNKHLRSNAVVVFDRCNDNSRNIKAIDCLVPDISEEDDLYNINENQVEEKIIDLLLYDEEDKDKIINKKLIHVYLILLF